jgi:hypothetical protein
MNGWIVVDYAAALETGDPFRRFECGHPETTPAAEAVRRRLVKGLPRRSIPEFTGPIDAEASAGCPEVKLAQSRQMLDRIGKGGQAVPDAKLDEVRHRKSNRAVS